MADWCGEVSLPRREPTQEERIQTRMLAVLSVADLRRQYEAGLLLQKAADALAKTDEALSLECVTKRLEIDKALGILWDWREDIGVPMPKGSREIR